MTFRVSFYMALAALGSLVNLAPAQAAQPVVREVFGGQVVYHAALCPTLVGAGSARCFSRIRTDAAGTPLVGKPATAAAAVAPQGFGPADLRRAYNVVNVSATGGTNVLVGIVDAFGYPNAEADLAKYRAQYGLPPCTVASGCLTIVNQSGGRALPGFNSGWAGEQALDLDMVSAMCPKCRILLVQTTGSSDLALSTGVNTAVARGAKVVSNSYGGGENGSQSYLSAYNHPGVAITASTGDEAYAAGPQFPATAPSVIAVGGTALVAAANPRGFTESAWTSAGSGCSRTYGKPSWQHDPFCLNRMEADISAVADPATGVAVYGPSGFGAISQWGVVGGTSVSAPLIGGIIAASGANMNGAQQIWLNAGRNTNDVTTGANGSCGGTYFCGAGVGYDGPTGWGTPNGVAAFMGTN
jgi:subtilase family serine protease